VRDQRDGLAWPPRLARHRRRVRE